MRTAVGLVAVIYLFATPRVGQAQEDLARDRGWLSLGAGAGRIDLAAAGASTHTAFMLELSGGFWLTDRLGLGVHLGGWTIEGFDLWNPEEGESVSEVFAQVRFRPSVESPLYLRLESGWASYTVNDPARVVSEGDVLGWRLGAAWELAPLAGVTLAPSIVASWGGSGPAITGSFDYRGVGLILGLVWAF